MAERFTADHFIRASDYNGDLWLVLDVDPDTVDPRDWIVEWIGKDGSRRRLGADRAYEFHYSPKLENKWCWLLEPRTERPGLYLMIPGDDEPIFDYR